MIKFTNWFKREQPPVRSGYFEFKFTPAISVALQVIGNGVFFYNVKTGDVQIYGRNFRMARGDFWRGITQEYFEELNK